MKNFWQKLDKPILALAPMAGVTDTPFRQMCKHWGADVIYTEFVSVDALVHGNNKTRELIGFSETEQPVVCQIFGSKPELFYQSVKILEEMGFSGIDINFGCPAYKIVKSGGGVKLMRNLNLCHELVQAACEGSGLPISIKIRASIKGDQAINDKTQTTDNFDCSMNQVTALDLVNKIKSLPLGAIMLHARSYEQPFDGTPDLDMVTQVRKIWPGILLANGGIYSPEIAKQVLEQTKADGLGIARGSWGRPWIFKQIKDYLNTGNYQVPEWDETKKIILKHSALALNAKGQYGLIELRKHLAWYAKGIKGAAQLRAKLVQVKTLDDITRALESVK